MQNNVLKKPWGLIFLKIASPILDRQNSKEDQTEDFLSILKPSEITKIYRKMDRNKSITQSI